MVKDMTKTRAALHTENEMDNVLLEKTCYLIL